MNELINVVDWTAHRSGAGITVEIRCVDTSTRRFTQVRSLARDERGVLLTLHSGAEITLVVPAEQGEPR